MLWQINKTHIYFFIKNKTKRAIVIENYCVTNYFIV